MVSKWLIDVVLGVPAWLFAHMGTLSLPQGITDAPATIQSGLAGIGPWGFWIPLSAIALGITVIGTSLLLMVGIKGARIVASFLTLGGGA